MLVAVLGSHLAAAFVGVGMSVLLFGCAKVASRMNSQAAAASSLRALAWHSARFAVGLVCATLISLPWLYLLLELRIPPSAFLSLIFGLAVSAYLFIRFGVFGSATFVGTSARKLP
jgi:hypothetical protein